MSEIKCVFCKHECNMAENADGSRYWVQCDSTECSAEGPVKKTRDEALSAWEAAMCPVSRIRALTKGPA